MLSSLEPEYVALYDTWTKFFFVQMIMEFLGQPVEYTIKAYCDNVGPIYIAYTEKISRRKKYVDMTTHFFRS